MKKQTISIISILAIGSLLSTVYAATTIITDNSISTSNLIVSGSCSGCSNEESFTNYNTIALNTTVSSGHGFVPILYVGNDGAVMGAGTSKNFLVYLNGTTSFLEGNFGNDITGLSMMDQSASGQYRVIIDGTNNLISVFKSGQKIQDL